MILQWWWLPPQSGTNPMEWAAQPISSLLQHLPKEREHLHYVKSHLSRDVLKETVFAVHLQVTAASKFQTLTWENLGHPTLIFINILGTSITRSGSLSLGRFSQKQEKVAVPLQCLCSACGLHSSIPDNELATFAWSSERLRACSAHTVQSPAASRRFWIPENFSTAATHHELLTLKALLNRVDSDSLKGNSSLGFQMLMAPQAEN